MENAISRVVRHRLGELRNEILEFSEAANDCNIIMATYNAENIGDIEGSLSHGAMINDKAQHIEYDILIESFGKAKTKLLSCTCG